jgi:hypothetical protein
MSEEKLVEDVVKAESRVEEFLLKKFRRAQKMNSHGDGTPAWKNVFFLLDLIGQGDFYGTFQVKVLGCVTKDAKILERTFKVDEMYRDVENPGQRQRA